MALKNGQLSHRNYAIRPHSKERANNADRGKIGLIQMVQSSQP